MENVKKWKFDDSIIKEIEKIVGESLHFCFSVEYNSIWNIVRRKVYNIIPEDAPKEEQEKAIAFAKDELWNRAGDIYDNMDESQW